MLPFRSILKETHSRNWRNIGPAWRPVWSLLTIIAIREQFPLPPFEETQKRAEELCSHLDGYCKEEWRQLSKSIRDIILGGGRPAPRPPSTDIADRDAVIVKQVRYWLKAEAKSPKKSIYAKVGNMASPEER